MILEFVKIKCVNEIWVIAPLETKSIISCYKRDENVLFTMLNNQEN